MPTSQPNILLIVTDDQRHDTVAALGNAHIQTPHLDRLVEGGTAFTHAFIPGGTSGAVCMPSRAMLHTGRSLFRITDRGQTILPEHVTLAETFRAAGYRTFGTGKWHNGKGAFARGFTDGDEIFFGGMADHWNVPVHGFDPTGQYGATCRCIPDPGGSNIVIENDCDHISAGCHSTDLITDAAAAFIEGDDGEKPFFAVVSFLAPHDPRSMPQQYLDAYDPGTLPLPPNFMPGHPFDNGDLHIRDEELAPFPRDPVDTQEQLAEYYAMITHLDAGVGHLLDTLQTGGLRENTIIAVVGDNGLAMGQHGLFGKQSLYEHSVRVPMILAGPGVPEGARRDALVYLFDLYPTLCELAGIAPPASVEGQSLTPALNDASAQGRESLYLAYRHLHRGVRTRTHKLIEYVLNGQRTMTQLFDLTKDPCEMQNLADDRTVADTLATLRAELFRLRDAWGDTDGDEYSQIYWDGYGA